MDTASCFMKEQIVMDMLNDRGCTFFNKSELQGKFCFVSKGKCIII